MTEETRRDCFKCRFFYVTWEPEHPNGCRAMGFKTKQLPSMVVFQASGKPCSYFKTKGKKES
ncbi:hypothetical protein [Desulfospira joergensenii]|uniref:hypothetical protein n=1 Tax=Desulfospira joergensenii TaxID=53329 RepID=UPI0003B3A5AD|nr:hypothetical protein [Desulfospira joergensenii]